MPAVSATDRPAPRSRRILALAAGVLALALSAIPGTLAAAAGAEEQPNLVVNPDLVDGDGDVACFFAAGWGEHDAAVTVEDDVPADAPAGARSVQISVTERVSGDTKLLQSEAAGCAPEVEAGVIYDISVDYRSTTAANSLTVFSHTETGWGYWTDLGALPATEGWATATAHTPPIPDGVDRISFGVSISADGELATTGYSLRAPAPDTEPGPGDPAVTGAWDVLENEMPHRAIHATLLSDGRVLLVAGSGNAEDAFTAGEFTAAVWDPVTDTYKDLDVPYDMFCAGHVTLPDGKVLIAGGTDSYPADDEGPTTFRGSAKSYYFDPADDAFHPTNDMSDAHWYPTLTKLADGDLWSAGGIDGKAEGTVVTEIFDYQSMSWLPGHQVPQTWSYWGTYPHMYLLDDGTLMYAGAHTFGNGLPGTGASLYDWENAQIWDVPGLREKDLRDQAASVLLPPAQDQRVMIVGGGNTETNIPAIDLVDIIDLTEDDPEYVPGPDLPGDGKLYVNLVNLPDRTVLAADGARFNRAGDVLTAALYDPAANAWTSIDPDPVGRNYHSSALVLPDGRVVTFGSNPGDNSFETRVSVYSPPYLFRGERPTIGDAPDTLAYGEAIELAATGDIASASLMSPMSATHQTDTNARLVDLPIAENADGGYTAQLTDNPNLLPPGPYMLTVLDTDGMPSVAHWVWVS